MDLANEMDGLPSYYFSEQSFEGVAGINGDAVAGKKYKKGTCSACAFACKLPTRDEATGVETEGPEFETLYAFGSNQGVGDLVDIMRANELCDTLGMDTISAGVTVAAYLASEDEFGNADLAQEITEKIAYREGVGDLLAEGVARCHDELGVENWTVKGLEFAAHDGRVIQGQGLSYAVANRGADHMYSVLLRAEYNGDIDPEGTLGKAELLVEYENHAAFRDTGIICAFGNPYITDEHLETLFDADYAELLSIGAETVLRERHFNNARGFDRTDDQLPYELPDIEAAIEEYYAERGWNDDGTVPEGAIDAVPTLAD
jgi:aldehyde:ferredoxin oxidoreductase